MEVSSPKFHTAVTPLTDDKKAARKNKSEKQKDVFKDTPLRNLAYADEIGETMRPMLSACSNPIVRKLPSFAYIPAMGYSALSVIDKFKKGADGTGEKPSVKAGAREAAYQGVVSFAAPMLIAKGARKAAAAICDNKKVVSLAKKLLAKPMKFLKNNKVTGKFMSKAGMPGKIAAAGITILALKVFSKPVDEITEKLFNKVVDPMIKLNSSKTEE